VSGGYPRNHVQAINADGSGKTAWENGSRVYVPSMVVHEGHLYAVLDGGVATCWESSTGKKKWDGRLGGTFTSSLVLTGDTLYGTNEAGKTFVFKADPAKFTLVSENTLGSEAYATPAICGGRIYHRVVETSGGGRQEVLYCLGEK
jgi:outer membrane protein assembly factor BamB